MDGLRLPPLIEEVIDPSGDREKGQLEEEGGVEKGGVTEEEEEEDYEEERERELDELRGQVVQLLLELEATREVSQRHEETFLELQGLLEDERLATAHQAESFTRQIQRLQAQLRSVREELDALEEEKESELAEAQEELRVAQEEVLLLQQAAEEAAGERENDIASMQEELCRLRAELQRLRAASQGYELEVTTLRAEIAMKSRGGGGDGADGAMSQLKEDYRSLKEECQSLADNNQELTSRLKQLQQDQQLQQASRTDDIYMALKEETSDVEDLVKTDGYITLSQSQPIHQSNARPAHVPSGKLEGNGLEVSALKAQLQEAEERAQEVQRECEGLKEELVELQTLYDSSQRERAGLDQELLCCRAELEKLVGRSVKGNKSESWHLAVAGAVAMTAVVALVVSGIMRAVA
ncbi:Coiled-coil domain-containing protein 136 [Merluccius polli]|uniref:Coiled-coil domain-containing protein 136 n=1 Tax=Merluccius polli TaxID=89951 RepID=A0AA47MJY1_MERPO|nr:Coiled-coil domain-containing protein 136 [Merluccius polli]